MIGNDDCGQMSAWYIFSTLGLYPVNPAIGDFVLGLPQCSYAAISLQKGKVLTIHKMNKQFPVYSIKLNKKDWIGNTVSYKQLTEGARLEWQ
jgi:putative alpha-1,2-mannosidase